MCGLLGEFGKMQSPKSEFDSLLKLSENRGSDMIGYYNNLKGKKDETPFLQFGFNRLSILDLSQDGQQPMYSKDRRYVITFNGEIYNFLELRSLLESGGHKFYSKTDTEVLLAAWQKWGIGCVHKLKGMFSFVIDLNSCSKI